MMPAVAVFIGGAIVTALAAAAWWSIGVIRLDRQRMIERRGDHQVAIARFREEFDLLNRSRPYDWGDERDDRRYP